jgi:drug/metabolite transporter (DMT)-like permease
MLSARVHDDLPPLALAWGGLVTGGIALALLGLVHALPYTASASDVMIAQHRTSWLIPVLGLSLIAAATSYLTGIHAARALGAKIASFVGLSEVLFAALFAWLLLGQRIGPVQMLGGLLVLAGVALVRIDEQVPSPATPTFDEEHGVEASPIARASLP